MGISKLESFVLVLYWDNLKTTIEKPFPSLCNAPDVGSPAFWTVFWSFLLIFFFNFLLYISGSHFSFGFSKVENWEWVLKWREWPCSVTSCFCVLLCQPLSRCVLLLHANSDNLGVFHSYLLATTYKCFLNHVTETLLLLVDSFIMPLQFSYGEFKFLFLLFYYFSFFCHT